MNNCPRNSWFPSQGKHVYEYSPHCEARVCNHCGEHAGLSSCRCGWRRPIKAHDPQNYDVIED